jgi:hypothetical protein
MRPLRREAFQPAETASSPLPAWAVVPKVVQWAVAGGITLGISRTGLAEIPDFVAREKLPERSVWAPTVGRVDGIAKATAAKPRTLPMSIPVSTRRD